MKGYKAFKKGFIAYGGFTYEIGKTYRIEGELKMCENGFHFCKNLIDVFGYYAFDEQNTVLAEVEADGAILQEGTKFCAEEIKVLKAIPWSEVSTVIKDGKCNSGKCNSGNCNSGDCNSGNYNSGNCNSGYRNSGNCNSGDCNSGNYNSGNCNSGYRNSGNYNSGYCNSGYRNSGNYNSGYRNSGNYNSGFFNSDTPTVRMFNKDSGLTFEEVYALDIEWSNLEKSKSIIKALPNYDAQIFFEATGIDWRDQ